MRRVGSHVNLELFVARLRRPLGRLRRRVRASWEAATNTRAVSGRESAESRLFLPVGYRWRLKPRYFDDIPSASGAVAQPDVYEVVEGLANALGASTIVDLGCGRAGKLAGLARAYAVVGADFGGNLEYCRRTHDWGSWVEMDLDSGDPFPLGSEFYRGAVLVSADVVEHLAHPNRLVGLIAAMLESAAVAVVSTPDRVRTWGVDHLGPPPNPSHMREWDLAEFREFLQSCGLQVIHAGYTRANTLDEEGHNILAVCAGSRISSEQADRAALVAQRIAERAVSASPNGRREVRQAADAPPRTL